MDREGAMCLTAEKKKELMLKAADIRQKTVEIIIRGNGGHIGGSTLCNFE